MYIFSYINDSHIAKMFSPVHHFSWQSKHGCHSYVHQKVLVSATAQVVIPRIWQPYGNYSHRVFLVK